MEEKDLDTLDGLVSKYGWSTILQQLGQLISYEYGNEEKEILEDLASDIEED